MKGLVALVGSGEYLPVMEDVDRHLLESLQANGHKPRVVCLSTAAGQEGEATINRWSEMGVSHFRKLGADAVALPIIDRESADDPQWESKLENADLIYFSGGNPRYLHQTLDGSRAWHAAQRAWERGAVYAGCSAGAMILARRIPSFRVFGVVNGFDAIPAEFVIPHFDATPLAFKPLVAALKSQIKKGERLIGIDEDTALIGAPNGEWKVMGKSCVHVFTHEESRTYQSGQTLMFDPPA